MSALPTGRTLQRYRKDSYTQKKIPQISREQVVEHILGNI